MSVNSVWLDLVRVQSDKQMADWPCFVHVALTLLFTANEPWPFTAVVLHTSFCGSFLVLLFILAAG